MFCSFKHANPDDKATVPGGYLSDINESSEVIYPDAVADRYMLESVVATKNYQFERVGFFAMDIDSRLEEKKVS